MFGTSGIRGPITDTITTDLALSLGRALAADADTVVIGRDTRTTGSFLADALSAGLRECGTDVIRIGTASTPTIARSVEWTQADAGVSVTASHNPPGDNGFKLWQPSGQSFTQAAQDAIETRIRTDDYPFAPWDSPGSETPWHAGVREHQTIITDTVSSSPLSVIVDVGNGTGGITAAILDELGCHVETLNGQPDGRFPGRPSEPTESHCETLCQLVETTDADLGIAHDGDADRMLAVTDTGTWIPGDVLLALFAGETATCGDRIAAPLNTSLAVDDYLAETGVSVTRTPVGDVFVAEATTADGVVFGGEPSGAWIWPEQTLCPDGPLAAAKLVELVSQSGPLTALVDQIDPYPIHRTALDTTDKNAVMSAVRSSLADRYESDSIDSRDGFRVDLGDAWFLVRPSGTESLIRVTAEARQPERATEVFTDARTIVESAITDHA